MAIAALRNIVLDCPDPIALARFYQQVVGGEIEEEDPGWVNLGGLGNVRLSFQEAPDLVPPTWPRPDVPQQLHLDLWVEDIEPAEQQVLALGARPLDTDDQGGTRDFRAYADPSGHPFCLCFAVGE